jgi:hypothetical protein
MMKIILSTLMFSLNLVFALELNKVDVILPLGLAQLDKSILKDGENSIKYSTKLYTNKNQATIYPKVANTKTIDGFMSSLIYSYINQDQKLFKSLMNKKSAKLIDFDSDKFQYSFDFLKKIKKPHLKYVYEYQDGYIVSWRAIGLITDRILFIKKVDRKFKMFDLAIPKDDHYFWNMGLYFKFGPFNTYEPKSVKARKVDNNYQLNVSINGFKNWIYIYSRNDKKRKIIAVADNYANNKQYKDYNLDASAIELKVPVKVFKEMGDDLRIVESSYPLEEISANADKESIKLKLP